MYIHREREWGRECVLVFKSQSLLYHAWFVVLKGTSFYTRTFPFLVPGLNPAQLPGSHDWPAWSRQWCRRGRCEDASTRSRTELMREGWSIGASYDGREDLMGSRPRRRGQLLVGHRIPFAYFVSIRMRTLLPSTPSQGPLRGKINVTYFESPRSDWR